MDLINDRITIVNNLYNVFSKTVSAGDLAVTEIDEALEAISDAETTEILDMFTDNKVISVMSSLDNQTAKSETSEAAQAIKNFQK